MLATVSPFFYFWKTRDSLRKLVFISQLRLEDDDLTAVHQNPRGELSVQHLLLLYRLKRGDDFFGFSTFRHVVHVNMRKANDTRPIDHIEGRNRKLA